MSFQILVFIYLFNWFAAHLATRRLWSAYKVKSSKNIVCVCLCTTIKIQVMIKRWRGREQDGWGKVGLLLVHQPSSSVILPNWDPKPTGRTISSGSYGRSGAVGGGSRSHLRSKMFKGLESQQRSLFSWTSPAGIL